MLEVYVESWLLNFKIKVLGRWVRTVGMQSGPEFESTDPQKARLGTSLRQLMEFEYGRWVS